MYGSIYSEGANGAYRMVELRIDGTSCQACDFELCFISVRLYRQSWSHEGIGLWFQAEACAVWWQEGSLHP